MSDSKEHITYAAVYAENGNLPKSLSTSAEFNQKLSMRGKILPIPALGMQYGFMFQLRGKLSGALALTIQCKGTILDDEKTFFDNWYAASAIGEEIPYTSLEIQRDIPRGNAQTVEAFKDFHENHAHLLAN